MCLVVYMKKGGCYLVKSCGKKLPTKVDEACFTCSCTSPTFAFGRAKKISPLKTTMTDVQFLVGAMCRGKAFYLIMSGEAVVLTTSSDDPKPSTRAVLRLQGVAD